MSKEKFLNEARTIFAKAIFHELVRRTPSKELREVLDLVFKQESIKFEQAIENNNTVIRETKEMLHEVRTIAMEEVTSQLFELYLDVNK